MKGTDRLDPYMGADIFFGGVAGQKIDANAKYLKAGGGRAVGDYDKSVTTGVSTMSWGVAAVAGLDYFFADHLAVGAEFGWGYKMSTINGGEKTTKTNTGGTLVSKTAKASSSAKTTTGDLGVTGATLSLSWYFGM